MSFEDKEYINNYSTIYMLFEHEIYDLVNFVTASILILYASNR